MAQFGRYHPSSMPSTGDPRQRNRSTAILLKTREAAAEPAQVIDNCRLLNEPLI
jgi:hypothetical protein